MREERYKLTYAYYYPIKKDASTNKEDRHAYTTNVILVSIIFISITTIIAQPHE